MPRLSRPLLAAVALLVTALGAGACSATPAPATPAVPTAAVDADHIIDLELTGDLKIKQAGQQVSTIPVRQGDTYTFRVTNTGGVEHDFLDRVGCRPERGGRRVAWHPALEPGHSGVPAHVRQPRSPRLRLHRARSLRTDEGRLRHPAMTQLATDAICYRDAYLGSVEARILAVDADDGPTVVLDRTVFYPGGGGQPADRGLILRMADGRTWIVTGARKDGGAVVAPARACFGRTAPGRRPRPGGPRLGPPPLVDAHAHRPPRLVRGGLA